MELSITLIIIIITVVVSLSANSKPELYGKLLFNPYQVVHRKEWYRIFTHALVHDNHNIFHLFFNMYVLYSFGNAVENMLLNNLGSLGELYYLFIYIGGVFIATIPALLKHKDNYGYNSVGASGAVSAVLFSTIAFVPFSGGIGILFLPFSIPPLIFGVLYIAYEMYMNKRGGTNIAHDAHIWGAIFGFVFTLLFVPGAFSNFITQLIAVFS
ncbi:MAG: rhomboid family intramembrane serine protease [Vicingus serpentipes]|nr:rhomboid family intramembrane serine protease [Vicingus serpentipes]